MERHSRNPHRSDLVEQYSPERLVLPIIWREGRADGVVETKLWGWARTAQGVSAGEIADELNARDS